MGRSRLGWACKAVAPWCVALGFVVSITAEAGQDPSLGASIASQTPPDAPRFRRCAQALASSTLHLPGDLFDRTADGESRPRGEADVGRARRSRRRRRRNRSEDRSETGQESLSRRSTASRKGDPFIGLRPGFDARLNRRNGIGRAASAARRRSTAMAVRRISHPAAADARQRTGRRSSGAPQAPAVSADGGRTFDDGATPSLPLDVALNSSTPTPNDGVRIIVAAKAAPETTLAPKTAAGEKPDYAALIDPKDAARQQRCLAEAIYFEARSEPEDGQAAVAQVVLNRVRSGNYPANVCGVVYQDRNRPFACQFSFACEGKSLRIEEPGPWAIAVRIATGRRQRRRL